MRTLSKHLFALVMVAASGSLRAAEPSVSGVFKGNGKDVRIAYVSAARREPFADKPSIRIVFTEKDHSKDKKPDFKAAFGDYGSALVISVHEDGGIFGCEVVHTALPKSPFSSLGNIKMEDFKIADGKIQGRLVTSGVVETFGQTWEVNLKFTTAAPPAETVAESKPVASAKPTPKPPVPKDKPKPAATGPKPKAGDLPLPQDAANVEIKKLVGQINLTSATDIKMVTNELVAKLKDQGWTSSSGDLITPNSVILHRTKGTATLTIFVKPAGSGSTVRILSQGLSWDD